jgi:hypothetical protein
VIFTFNEEEDAIDVGGISFAEGKKWRDARGNPSVTILVDDIIPEPRRARAVEIRGDAEIHETGGDRINPRFGNFTPEFLRIRPRRIVSWGVGARHGREGDAHERPLGGLNRHSGSRGGWMRPATRSSASNATTPIG